MGSRSDHGSSVIIGLAEDSIDHRVRPGAAEKALTNFGIGWTTI